MLQILFLWESKTKQYSLSVKDDQFFFSFYHCSDYPNLSEVMVDTIKRQGGFQKNVQEKNAFREYKPHLEWIVLPRFALSTW